MIYLFLLKNYFMLDKMLDEDPSQACRPVEDLAKVIDGFTEQDPHPCREEERDERIKGNDRLETKLTSNLKKFLFFFRISKSIMQITRV